MPLKPLSREVQSIINERLNGKIQEIRSLKEMVKNLQRDINEFVSAIIDRDSKIEEMQEEINRLRESRDNYRTIALNNVETIKAQKEALEFQERAAKEWELLYNDQREIALKSRQELSRFRQNRKGR